MATNLYKVLDTELTKADVDMQSAIANRGKATPGSPDYLFADAMVRAHQAKALVLSQEIDNILLQSGAKGAIDQYNNGLISIKELVETLQAIEADLLKA